MRVVEFRITMPMTVDEYHIGQLWVTAEESMQATGGGEGVEILENQAFTGFSLNKGNVDAGQYTLKAYRFESKVPAWARILAPKGSMEIMEESFNCFPYCLTVVSNPGYMKEDFYTSVESVHYDNDLGKQENALQLTKEQLENREVVFINIAAPLDDADYMKESDPNLIRSEKTGRGPLSPDWIKNRNQNMPVMTAYKVFIIDFKWLGLQDRIEKFVATIQRRLFTKFHRELFCYMDRWYGLTMEDIRELEKKTQKELNDKRDRGSLGSIVNAEED